MNTDLQIVVIKKVLNSLLSNPELWTITEERSRRGKSYKASNGILEVGSSGWRIQTMKDGYSGPSIWVETPYCQKLEAAIKPLIASYEELQERESAVAKDQSAKQLLDLL
jgi:hypothetical protein